MFNGDCPFCKAVPARRRTPPALDPQKREHLRIAPQRRQVSVPFAGIRPSALVSHRRRAPVWRLFVQTLPALFCTGSELSMARFSPDLHGKVRLKFRKSAYNHSKSHPGLDERSIMKYVDFRFTPGKGAEGASHTGKGGAEQSPQPACRRLRPVQPHRRSGAAGGQYSGNQCTAGPL